MTFSTFNDSSGRTLLALILALGVSLLATRARALTRSGAIASTLVGTLVVAGSGWWCGFVLVLYFVSASWLARVSPAASTSVRQLRGNQRDYIQVLANGGCPALLSFLAAVTGSAIWISATLVSIAVAAADTWATELGRIGVATPRSILNGNLVPAGTSGAISLPGTTASIAASLLIAGSATIGYRLGWIESFSSTLLSASLIAIGGILGSFLDSLLGATIQGTFYCEECAEPTESAQHTCGYKARQIGGFRWVTNDVVNLTSIFVPATIAAVIQAFLVQSGNIP